MIHVQNQITNITLQLIMKYCHVTKIKPPGCFWSLSASVVQRKMPKKQKKNTWLSRQTQQFNAKLLALLVSRFKWKIKVNKKK